MPSPRAPSRTTVRSASAVIAGSEQEFLVARTTPDRRRDDVENAPMRLARQPVGHQLDRPLPLGGVTHDAALADGTAPGLELRFDQSEEPSLPLRQGQGRGQSFGKRNEAHIRDD